MSVIGKLSALTIGIGLIASVGIYSVNASTISLSGQAPKKGSVTLDDNDHVVSASSPIIYGLAKEAEKEASNPIFGESKTAVNYAHSRWVYYSDRHGLHHYKVGHSNFYHRTEYHTSYAKVGGNGRRSKQAGPNKWSYAAVAGHGTFRAYYNAPYL
ncbi:hypothetical protein [Lactobacillus equicursoris]|uniref:hypothetical protein n=1 Tax=Lactobacillus equicursoris TaxID=420645 RepID=UPI0039946C78